VTGNCWRIVQPWIDKRTIDPQANRPPVPAKGVDRRECVEIIAGPMPML
jgi:hypothetical protein